MVPLKTGSGFGNTSCATAGTTQTAAKVTPASTRMIVRVIVLPFSVDRVVHITWARMVAVNSLAVFIGPPVSFIKTRLPHGLDRQQ